MFWYKWKFAVIQNVSACCSRMLHFLNLKNLPKHGKTTCISLPSVKFTEQSSLSVSHYNTCTPN